MQHTELHTYLALAGNQRLEHLEDEIFADKTATTIYLHNLCREYNWYPYNGNKNACLAHRYSLWIIKGAWPAAETVIIKDAEYASLYARNVIKTRWPAAELEHIRSRNKMWRVYVRHFGI